MFLFSWLLLILGFCPRVLSALRPSLWSARSSSRVVIVSPRLQFVLCSRLVRVLCCWHTICSGNPSPFLGGNPPVHGVIGVLPRPYGRLPTAQCIEGTAAAPPSSACVDPCGGLWPLLKRVQTHYQQVSLSPPGGSPERSAPFQKCGLALLSRLTILASMVVPSFSSCRVSPPRGVDQCLVRRKNILYFRIFCSHLIFILLVSSRSTQLGRWTCTCGSS